MAKKGLELKLNLILFFQLNETIRIFLYQSRKSAMLEKNQELV
jgi:hypothetical protein